MDTSLTIKVPEDDLKKAAEIFSDIDMDVEEALRQILKKAAQEPGFIEMFVGGNDETIAALNDNALTEYENAADMLKKCL